MEEKCVGCTCKLIRGIAHRRKLYSVSTRHVYPVLSGLMRECYQSEDVEKLLPPEDSQLSKEEIFVCLKCFRHLKKLIRLEKEKAQLEETLKSGFQKVKQVVELRAVGQPDEPPPTPSRSCRKHQRLSSSSLAAPLMKWHAPDTPTRRIIRQVHAPGTPAVSVSHSHNNSTIIMNVTLPCVVGSCEETKLSSSIQSYPVQAFC